MTVQQKDAAQAVSVFAPRIGRIVAAKMLTEKEKYFRIVMADGKPLGHKPGQFVEVSIFGIGEAPISICSSPTAGRLVRAVRPKRRLGHQRPPQAWRRATTIGLRGPFGNGFDMEAMKGKDVLFVAGGLGLAPARGVIQYVLDKRSDYGKVTILYGSRSPKDLLFTEDLKEWEAAARLRLPRHGRPPRRVLEGQLRRHHDALQEGQARRAEAPTRSSSARLSCTSTPSSRRFPWASRKTASSAASSGRMKCGVGRCGHCQIRQRYVCKEGPVFSYAQIKRLREGI